MKTKTKSLLLAIVFFIFSAAIVMGLLTNGYFSGAEADQLSGRWIKKPSYLNTEVDESAGDFSVAVIGDQQIVESSWKKYLESTYDYLAENKQDMNLKMVINVGDIFDVVDFASMIGGYDSEDPYGSNRGDDPENKYWWQQREFVSNQVKKLEDAQIPVALTMGNHDYEDMAFSYRINKTFNEAFPLSRFEKYAVGEDGVVDDTHYFGGAQYEDIEQAYYYFEGNGQKYMVLCMGIYPNDEMIAWANEIAAQNSDCKIIVNTHAYFDVDGTLEQRGDYLWNNFISQHENIMMVVCGHSWYDGGIVRKVDYGVNGNPVYQFMINTQGEEFGGAGVFAQMIFRADGTVDCAYYAPAVEEYAAELNLGENAGMYFMEENQFTFDLNIDRLSVSSEGETVVGNEKEGTNIYDNYVVYSPSNERWLQNVYAYKNAGIVSKKGLSATNGTGYVTYKLSAGDSQRYKGLTVLPFCKFPSSGYAAFQIDLSTDGENWQTALYQDNSTGRSGEVFILDRYVKGAKELWLRVYVTGTDFCLTSVDFEAETVQTVLAGGGESFTVGFNSATATQADWSDGMLDSLDAYLINSVLGTGSSYYQGGKAYVAYCFDAPAGATLQRLNVTCVMDITKISRTYSFEERVYDGITYSQAQTFGFKEKDSELALRILISYDGGKNFETLVTYDNADYAGTDVSFQYALPVEGYSSAVVKLQYFGSTWTDVTIKSIAFSGSYSAQELDEDGYVLNGGTIYSDPLRPVRDGYVFDGWYVNGERTDDPASYEGTGVAIEAKWKKIVSIVYVTGGAQNDTQNKSVLTEGETLTLSDLSSFNGKTFGGWYDAEGNRVTQIVAEQDLILYAIFY